MFDDQVLLARLHLDYASVISGTKSARYRQHPASTSARAVASGTYHPHLPNRSMERFLRWLQSTLETRETEVDPELLDALDAALAPYHGRARRLWHLSRSRLGSILPPATAQIVRAGTRRARAVGPVRMGSLRRLTPISRQFGYDRGQPIDRHYIEAFIGENSHLVAGTVLEVGDSEYTHRFGGRKVSEADVLNIKGDQEATTIVADLADGQGIPSERFDCIIVTQTLQLIYDLPAAVQTLHRALRPGGTVLATFPGISPISTDQWASTWHWALTPISATRLFSDVFGIENIEVRSHGNVLTTVAFLHGMSSQELSRRSLATHDPQFPMLISVRAHRPIDPPRVTD
jgi:SAM-dependent methyltransferase